MSAWYEVYDNVDVQLMTRKRAAAMTGVVALVIMFSIAVLAVGMEGSLPLPAALGLITVGWVVFSGWCIHRTRRLRRLVWCVKLSDREIVGYDYERRKSSIGWLDVDRIDIRDAALVIVGRGDVHLEIAHLFPDFAELSHRIMRYGDHYSIPVFIDGRPWQQLDVYDVYPFLADEGMERGNVVKF